MTSFPNYEDKLETYVTTVCMVDPTVRCLAMALAEGFGEHMGERITTMTLGKLLEKKFPGRFTKKKYHDGIYYHGVSVPGCDKVLKERGKKTIETIVQEKAAQIPKPPKSRKITRKIFEEYNERSGIGMSRTMYRQKEGVIRWTWLPDGEVDWDQTMILTNEAVAKFNEANAQPPLPITGERILRPFTADRGQEQPVQETHGVGQWQSVRETYPEIPRMPVETILPTFVVVDNGPPPLNTTTGIPAGAPITTLVLPKRIPLIPVTPLPPKTVTKEEEDKKIYDGLVREYDREVRRFEDRISNLKRRIAIVEETEDHNRSKAAYEEHNKMVEEQTGKPYNVPFTFKEEEELRDAEKSLLEIQEERGNIITKFQKKYGNLPTPTPTQIPMAPFPHLPNVPSTMKLTISPTYDQVTSVA